MEAVAADGSEAQAVAEGIGMPILVVHGGMGDRTVWQPVTDLLRDRFRTVRLERRRYRMDLSGPVTMAQEVEHVAAIAAKLRQGGPRTTGEAAGHSQSGADHGMSSADGVAGHGQIAAGRAARHGQGAADRPVLVGHSSGAVVVLEALVADPGAYAGAVLYEPPIVIGPPLSSTKLAAARAELARDQPGRALSIFLREVVRMPAALAWLAGLLVGRHPEYRQRVVRQLDDNDALDELGVRLAEYARLEMPILLIGGDRSPRHLAERLDALERTLPRSRRLVLHGQGHNAERRAPERVAKAIAKFIDEEIGPR